MIWGSGPKVPICHICQLHPRILKILPLNLGSGKCFEDFSKAYSSRGLRTIRPPFPYSQTLSSVSHFPSLHTCFPLSLSKHPRTKPVEKWNTYLVMAEGRMEPVEQNTAWLVGLRKTFDLPEEWKAGEQAVVLLCCSVYLPTLYSFLTNPLLKASPHQNVHSSQVKCSKMTFLTI